MLAKSEIYSPIANVITFDNSADATTGTPGDKKGKLIKTPQKANKFRSEFSILKKLGEGSFGEAFAVRSNLDN